MAFGDIGLLPGAIKAKGSNHARRKENAGMHLASARLALDGLERNGMCLA